jgi:lipopolysaccharide transport system ATP-binding protein
MSETVIQVDNLSKQFRIGVANGMNSLRARAIGAARNLFSDSMRTQRPEDFWALRDVSFTVAQGEVLGIIGHNGAGKSTLLKILSRIVEPTGGRVAIHGRVGSLLEVGTGFHPELTGRENIYLNGAILGMKRAEITRRFDEIVEFSGVEQFIDTPVKRYSSGMYVRLAFAVAAHLEPEILIIDEVLAVGDVGFQRRCLGKINQVAREGRTVLFVSHNMAAVQGLCTEAILLEHGSIAGRGNPEQMIDRYLDAVLSPLQSGIPLASRDDRTGNGAIRLTGFRLESDDGQTIMAVRSGMNVTFAFEYQCSSAVAPANIDIGFSLHRGGDEVPLFVLYSSYAGREFGSIPDTGTFRCRIPRFPVPAGRYRVEARVVVGGDEADWPQGGIGYVDVETGDFYGSGSSGYEHESHFLLNGCWDVNRS